MVCSIWSAALIVYWLLFHITLGNGQPRYLISVAPVVAVGAGYLIALGISAVSRRTKRASA